jgi:hypothetical protein
VRIDQHVLGSVFCNKEDQKDQPYWSQKTMQRNRWKHLFVHQTLDYLNKNLKIPEASILLEQISPRSNNSQVHSHQDIKQTKHKWVWGSFSHIQRFYMHNWLIIEWRNWDPSLWSPKHYPSMPLIDRYWIRGIMSIELCQTLWFWCHLMPGNKLPHTPTLP